MVLISEEAPKVLLLFQAKFFRDPAAGCHSGVMSGRVVGDIHLRWPFTDVVLFSGDPPKVLLLFEEKFSADSRLPVTPK